MTPKELCLLLDYTARSDLRQACEKSFINRHHYKERGVKLLELLGLIERTKIHKTMYRYEPTILGYEVSEYLPSSYSDHVHIMSQDSLRYADGTTIAFMDVPRYSLTRDYVTLVRQLKQKESAS